MTKLEQDGQHTFLWHFAIADVSRAQHVHASDRDRSYETVHLQNLNCLASLRTKVIPASVSSRDIQQSIRQVYPSIEAQESAQFVW